MADHKHKKSKSHRHHGYDDDVEGQVNRAMQQVDDAMRQVRLADKQARAANKEGKRQEKQARHTAAGQYAGEQFGTPDFGQSGDNATGNININHASGTTKTFINIGSAQNIQVGCHNSMVINQGARPRRRDSYEKSRTNDQNVDFPGKGRDSRQSGDGEARSDSPPSASVMDILSCERLVTERDINLVCSEVGTNWRRFLRWLDFDDTYIERLNDTHRDDGIREVLFKALKDWQRKAGNAATLGNLAKVLQKISHMDIVERLTP